MDRVSEIKLMYDVRCMYVDNYRASLLTPGNHSHVDAISS